MDQETGAKQVDLEYQHADPYIVALLNTARQYLDLNKKKTDTASQQASQKV